MKVGFSMLDQERYKRLRSFLRQVNRQRRRQAQQIDILCRDLIAAQRRFIQDLDCIGFAASLYRSMLGVTDPGRLVDLAAAAITEHISGIAMLFYVRSTGMFKQYAAGTAQSDEYLRLLESVNTELAEAICRANKVCGLEDLLMLGMQASPALTARTSTVCVPISIDGRCFGVVLVCGPATLRLTAFQMQKLNAVAAGLASAIQACQQVHSE
ncbi:MAG: hypothetical protein QHH07_02740 [Sedimentisphaerales bacterium]|nr:hypothetical protein [Sedimentisphaerales bacterium]